MALSFFSNLKERKENFWKQCLECAARHPEWPYDGVKDFFSHWTAINRMGQMRWETLQFWGLGERMASFMKRRRHLESYWEIKLERARGKKFYEKTTTQLRAEAMEQEAQNAYDKYFEEQEARGKMKDEQ